MAEQEFTLTSYDPVYAIAPEVRIPEEAVKSQALRWMENMVCKEGEKPKLTDAFVNSHCEDFKNVEELLIFIRFNMYKENREVQELNDQNVICAELATRLVEDLPEDVVENSLYAARMRLEDMVARTGTTLEDFARDHGLKDVDALYEDVEARTIQSLKEDSALAAYAAHENLTLEPEDFYAIIPGEDIADKARKRQQLEMQGQLPQMEEYALKTKALNEVMRNAMIKRRATDSEWMRYGDTSSEVIDATQQFPENYMQL